MVICVFCDGGARGNPGPAGIGVAIKNESGELVHGFGKVIGVATNNVAEYTAVIEALNWVSKKLQEKPEKILMFLDSQLVVRQLSGIYRVKDSKLRLLMLKVREKEGELAVPVFYSHIPREENKDADRFVNQALDSNLHR